MGGIIITGASGLVGNGLLRRLGDRSDVTAVSRTRPQAAAESVRWNAHDFNAPWPPADLPAGPVDTIVHLAQSPHFRQFPERAMDVFNVNIRSTAEMLDFAVRSGAKRFVFASSGGIYGTGDQGFTEDQPAMQGDALGYYLGGKHCGEILAESYAGVLTVVILRFFFVYGAEQRGDMLVPRLVASVRDGLPITVQGPNGISINPVHVDDAAAAVAAAMTLDSSQKINVAGPQELSMREIAETIGAKEGRAPVIQQEDREPRSLIGDITKMKRLLHTPTVLFRDGVEDVCRALAARREAP